MRQLVNDFLGIISGESREEGYEKAGIFQVEKTKAWASGIHHVVLPSPYAAKI